MGFTLTIYGLILYVAMGIAIIYFSDSLAKALKGILPKLSSEWIIFIGIMVIAFGFGGFIS